MTVAVFFCSGETNRILRWSSQASSVPISVHQYEAEREQNLLIGLGQCEACKYTSQLAKGPVACRHARESAAATAFHVGVPAPFICHAGFACLSAPLILDETRITVTFGPYCPAEETRALEDDFLKRLEKLTLLDDDQAPVSLADIQCLPVSTVPAVAEQTVRMLWDHWNRLRSPEQDGPDEIRGSERSSRARRATPDSFNGASIATAIRAGKRDQARALIRTSIDQARTGKRTPVEVLRVRAVATATAAIESATRAGAMTGSVWDRFPEFLEKVRGSKTPLHLAGAVTDLLHVRRLQERRDAPESTESSLQALHDFISARLRHNVTLNEAAAAVGRHPTAITHFLQRKFGMSFSEYIGRLRIDMAKELLRQTRLSTEEVSRRIGIHDQSNFGKLFRKYELTTPAKYRQKYGKQTRARKGGSKQGS